MNRGRNPILSLSHPERGGHALTQTTLTTELDAHLHAGGTPIRYISADEAAFYRSRAEILRGQAIEKAFRAAAGSIARLFRTAPVLPNRRRGGKLVTAE